jgi:hypothetical protein
VGVVINGLPSVALTDNGQTNGQVSLALGATGPAGHVCRGYYNGSKIVLLNPYSLFTHINASGLPVVNFADLDSNSIFEISFEGVKPEVSGQLQAQISTNGVSYLSAGYNSYANGVRNVTTVDSLKNAGVDRFVLTAFGTTSDTLVNPSPLYADIGVSGTIRFFNGNNGQLAYSGDLFYTAVSGARWHLSNNGNINTGGMRARGINLFFSASNFAGFDQNITVRGIE